MTNISNIKLLAEMRLMANQARNEAAEIANPQGDDFGKILKGVIDDTNDKLQQSSELKKSFVAGEPGVTLVDTMIASQKAGLAFDVAIQLRNKLLQAYQEIMSMPL